MKPFRPTVALCVAVLISSMALEAQSPSILEPKFERHQGPPLWISAEMVADSEKIIDLDMIDDFNLRGYVEKQRRSLGEQRLSEETKTGSRPTIADIPRSRCTSEILSAELPGGDHPSASIKDLATYSRSILRGTIRTIDPGFASGVPTSLLGVEISGAIKGNKLKSPIYISYPVAHFSIGPLSFCNAEKGFEPRPGDEIILFDYIGPIDREQALYAPRLEQTFFQGQNKALFLPSRLKNTPELRTARSLDDVAEQLKATGALRDSGGGAR
jgi:hypothetical protein